MTGAVLRVGLLMCGHVADGAEDIGGDYPELFADLFAAHPVELVRYDVDLGQLPVALDECDGWITSPSRSSAYADEPWIHDAVELVSRLIAEERPFAGICFGHQLMAQACGGRVEKAEVGWGVGAKTYELVSRRDWMDPPADRFTLIASHEDQVTVMPPGAELLATAAYCPVAMMALGERAFGLQPHPEFTAPLSARILDLREDLIGLPTVTPARASLTTPLDEAVMASWIVNFLSGRN